MAASTKGLSLGKNEDPKGRKGQAKQVALDGITVTPSVGSTKIQEPKVQNARWFGESAVQPAALTKIPMLDLPNVAGVIENATPKDQGRMGDSLTTFAEQVVNYGESTRGPRKRLREENEAIANKILSTWGEDPTKPVKDLSTYIDRIQKSIDKIKTKKTLTEEDLQTIRDYEKLITQINNKRNLSEVLLSKDRERVVKNRAMGWNSYADTHTVADLNLAGGITDADGDLATKKISELDPSSQQYISAFNNYVYGDMNLSAFELKNVEGMVSNILYNSRVSQEKKYTKVQKNNILKSSYQNIEINLEKLVQKDSPLTEPQFISELQDDVEFLRSTHMFSPKEIEDFIKQSVGMIQYYLGKNGGDVDVEDLINTIFLGKNLGKEDQILPLMTGKKEDRVLEGGKINEKLFLINAIGGEYRLNQLISEASSSNATANSNKKSGYELTYTNEFNEVLLEKPEGSNESYLSLLIKGDTDDISGNVHVSTVIKLLEDKKRDLISKAGDNVRKIEIINDRFNQKLSDIKNNLLVSDYKEEIAEFNDRSLKVALGEATETEIADLKKDLFIFKDTYKGLPKLDEDLSLVYNNLENYASASNKTSLKFANDLVSDLYTTYANKQGEDFDKDTTWNKNKPSIDARINEIVQEAIRDNPNNIQARNKQISDTINQEWNNGGFISGRNVNNSPQFNMGDPLKVSKDYLNANGFNKKGMLDSQGFFTDNSFPTFKAQVRNIYRPLFNSQSLYRFEKVGGRYQPSGGLILMWMSGDDMPEGWDIIEKNLEKMDNMSVTQFFEEQLEKNNIDPKAFPLDFLKSLEGKTKQERREEWAKFTGIELSEKENVTGVLTTDKYEASAFIENNNTFYLGPYGTTGKEIQRKLNDANLGWYNLWGAV